MKKATKYICALCGMVIDDDRFARCVSVPGNPNAHVHLHCASSLPIDGKPRYERETDFSKKWRR